jgi:hypothetical protein
MKSFNALLYGADLPPVGVAVSAYFAGHRLVINEMTVEADVAGLVVSVGGFEHDELFLNWQAEGSRWALKSRTAADVAIVIASAPPQLNSELDKWHQRNRHIKTVWGTIAAIAGVVVLSVLLLWWQYDRALGWVAGHVPVSSEEKLGKVALEQLKAEGHIVDSGIAVKAVQDIGGQLTKGSRYHYQWLVKTDPTLNAFAMPGGIIVVHSALIEAADNPNELAAVLAHEVQHVEQRHSLKHMINSAGWATVLTVVLGDVSTAAAVIIHQAGAMYFSRDLEDEADRLGFQALQRAKISPQGMVTFFQKLEKEHGSSAPAWISSHPATSERIKTIQTLIKESPCADCRSLTYDWSAVKKAVKTPKKEA